METFLVIIVMINGSNEFNMTPMVGDFPSERICESRAATVAEIIIADPLRDWVDFASDCIPLDEIIPLGD